MKKIRLWLSIVALLGGVFVVVVSINASTGIIDHSINSKASQRQLYLNNMVLPDHIIYPLLMVADRIQLKLTPFPDNLWLRAEYGWRRLDYSSQLLAKNKKHLALATFTKSQKYFINASQETLDKSANNEIKLKMIKHLIAYLQEAKVVAENFDGAQKAVADDLINECEVLKLRLSQSLSS